MAPPITVAEIWRVGFSTFGLRNSPPGGATYRMKVTGGGARPQLELCQVASPQHQPSALHGPLYIGPPAYRRNASQNLEKIGVVLCCCLNSSTLCVIGVGKQQQHHSDLPKFWGWGRVERSWGKIWREKFSGAKNFSARRHFWR